VPRVESPKSMIVGAIINNLHQRVFDEIMTREDIPTNARFGDREDLTKAAGEKLQRTFKEQLIRARMMEDGMIDDFYCVYKIIIILNAIS